MTRVVEEKERWRGWWRRKMIPPTLPPLAVSTRGDLVLGGMRVSAVESN